MRFSALQRAEIAEIADTARAPFEQSAVSVLFNEPKLLKAVCLRWGYVHETGFSALQRAEIAESFR